MPRQIGGGEGLPIPIREGEGIDVAPYRIIIRLRRQGGLAPVISRHYAADEEQQQQGKTWFNHIKQNLASSTSQMAGPMKGYCNPPGPVSA
ncbi:hypothetical protein D3C72_1381920 [compost metagenome]